MFSVDWEEDSVKWSLQSSLGDMGGGDRGKENFFLRLGLGGSFPSGAPFSAQVCLKCYSNLFCFLCAGFAIGHAGELETLGMFLLAYFIVILTVLSISAISTNGAIEGGGAYCILLNFNIDLI